MRITISIFLLLTNHLFANNVAVSNISLTGQNTTDNFTLIRFDISWENSWRVSTGPSNWDAAWVFVKYRLATQTTWNHASLNWTDGTGSGDGHSEPVNANISSANDNGTGNAYGVFIHRDADMTQSNVNYIGVHLRWEYGDDGIVDDDSVEVCVFAIEMVYVPQGSFELGSGGSETGRFYRYPTTNNTYTVGSEATINVGTTTNNLYYVASSKSGDRLGPIPAIFPKGYDAFYMMKYELSQEQYVNFLNKLTNTQATTRKDGAAPLTNRYAISGATPGSYSTTNPNVPCNYLSWGDVVAYLDWTALRPMTELEYEKSCRGTLTAVANEYAWGSTSIASSVYTLSNAGGANEGIATNYSTVAGNIMYAATRGVLAGPLRCGIFAANGSNTGRMTSGSGYYGVMELSANLWERVVTVGNPTGRMFTGEHGNGVLDAVGDADVLNWPGINGLGAGFRGGSWTKTPVRLQVSDRESAASSWGGRSYAYGCRGVRLAP